MEETTDDLEMMEVGSSGAGEQQQQQRTDGDNWSTEKASEQQGGGLLGLAKRGVEMLREKLKGRSLWRSSDDGKLRVKENCMARSMEESEVRLEEIVEEGEEVTVDIEQVEDGGKDEKEGSSYSGTTAGYGFLEEIGDEEKDEELEKRNTENRKRKGREENVTMKVKGLKITPGWKERAEASRGDERWKRVVEKEETGVKEEKVEKIPLPESYDLGLDVGEKSSTHQ